MDKDNIDRVNGIISVLRDGIDFYQDGIEKVEDEQLKAIFIKMRAIRQDAVDQLSALVRANGEEPAERGTMRGSLSQAYADLRAMFGRDDEVMVSRLEEHEDRTLEEVQEFAQTVDFDPQARALAADLVTRFRSTHDEMKLLKDRWVR